MRRETIRLPLLLAAHTHTIVKKTAPKTTTTKQNRTKQNRIIRITTNG
jgi:hypothetical protein